VRGRGLSNRRLKVVALVLVVGSAAATATVMKGLPAQLADADLGRLTVAVVFEGVSWVTLPVYAWLLTTGFRHTSSRGRYAARLAALAVIAEVPYDLATSGRFWDASSQNPVFALLASLLVLWYIAGISGRPRADRAALTVAAALTMGAALFFFGVGLRLGLMPCGLLILVFTLVFWFLGKRENTMMLVGSTIGAVALVFPAFGFAVLHYRNGREGMRNACEKLLFYALYPVGLAAVALWRALAP
jgi:hypothetical protein